MVSNNLEIGTFGSRYSRMNQVKFGQDSPCKSHFGMGVLLQICCIFSEHPFLKNTSGWLLLKVVIGSFKLPIFLQFNRRLIQNVFDPGLLIFLKRSWASFTMENNEFQMFEIFRLTLFFPIFPFASPENIREPLVFSYQGGQKGTLGRKRGIRNCESMASKYSIWHHRFWI